MGRQENAERRRGILALAQEFLNSLAGEVAHKDVLCALWYQHTTDRIRPERVFLVWVPEDVVKAGNEVSWASRAHPIIGEMAFIQYRLIKTSYPFLDKDVQEI